MTKEILIDSHFGMVRTALTEDRELVDYYEESPEQGRNKGNIYRGVVKRVDAPIQAAFVKFAGGRDGFLPLRDAAAGKPPQPGETVLVQVVKDEVGEKGAALTAKLSLSGRYLVFIPERDGEGGISSKIADEERAALKKVMGELQLPDGASIILRTAACEKSAAELQADLDRLAETYREILDRFGQGKEPGLLFREAPPALRYLREYYTEDVERIWVNQEDVLDQCRQFFYLYEPRSAAKVVLSQDGPLLFQRLGLEAEVEKLAARKVPLPSGANIVIDQAEALVAIDVNSAKAGGRSEEKKSGKGRGDLEATVFAVNLEAAAEIARQLRLRDLGGIIIVDFIDMEDEKHRHRIEEAMRRALSQDKAKTKVYDIGPLGIMQISRQRLRKAGHQFARLACEACKGRGWHASPSAGALTALRRLEERLHGKKAGQTLSLSAPYPVANKLVNEFRDHLLAMEKRYGCVLRVQALPTASGEPAIAVLGGNAEPARPGMETEAGSSGRDGRAGRPRPGKPPAKPRATDGVGDAGGRERKPGRRGKRSRPEAEAAVVMSAPRGESASEVSPESFAEEMRGAAQEGLSLAAESSVAIAPDSEGAGENAPARSDDSAPARRGHGRRGGRGRGRRPRSQERTQEVPRPQAVNRDVAERSAPARERERAQPVSSTSPSLPTSPSSPASKGRRGRRRSGGKPKPEKGREG